MDARTTTLWGQWLGMGKRLITEKQEQALKLCHHDFDGLSQQEAAKVMGVSQAVVSELLAKVKKVAPQFFPILTKQEAKCYHHLTVDGWSPDTIAEYLNMTINAVYLTFQRCTKKGLVVPNSHGAVARYYPKMDDRVKEKF